MRRAAVGNYVAAQESVVDSGHRLPVAVNVSLVVMVIFLALICSGCSVHTRGSVKTSLSRRVACTSGHAGECSFDLENCRKFSTPLCGRPRVSIGASFYARSVNSDASFDREVAPASVNLRPQLLSLFAIYALPLAARRSPL